MYARLRGGATVSARRIDSARAQVASSPTGSAAGKTIPTGSSCQGSRCDQGFFFVKELAERSSPSRCLAEATIRGQDEPAPP